MTRAFVFPGQGSQAVGMGQELAENFAAARDVFEEVNDALNEKLSSLMFEGPQDILTLTANAQPALMAVSMAVVKVLESEGGFTLTDKAKFVAGHSLGEYSALCAAGAITITDAARLLRKRGEEMQKAVPVGEGAMAALLGLSIEDAEAVAAAACAEEGVCTVANDNSDGQVVVSGSKAAVERSLELAKEKGGKRSVLLPVSAPFHCPMMEPAAEAMAEALNTITIQAPAIPVVANVVAEAVSEPEQIRKLLIEQIPGRVRWREGVLYMRDQGVEQLVELGAGKVLSGLVRRIDRSMKGAAVNGPADIESILAELA